MQIHQTLRMRSTVLLSYIKYIAVLFIISVSGLVFLRFPETAGQGISEGIDICLGTLIPSLYPFLIIASLVVNLDIVTAAENYFSAISGVLFRLPGKCAGVIFLSMIGGYPVGAKIIRELYKKNEITSAQAKQLMSFCVNPAPSFVISSVGFYMLGSKRIGFIMYFSIILSSLIIGFFSRFFADAEENIYIEKSSWKYSPDFSDAIIKSISSASKTMLNICSWVILFSCINKLIEISLLGNTAKFTLFTLLEVTNGCLVASTNLPVPIIAGIISFSGICTHFQLMSAVNEIGLEYRYFLASRILSGALSAVICSFILNIYPVSYDVFSYGTLPKNLVSSASLPVSVGMLIMCFLFVLGDNFHIKIRKKAGN